MKALLLAAGKGTRLRPLTRYRPKCLVKIGGKELLGNWIMLLENLGCKEIVINTHYLSEQVENYIKSNNHRAEIKITKEENLLNTGGTLMANLDILNDEENLIIHADNWTRIELINILEAHRNRPKECIMTMLTFDSKNPKTCGIVLCDENLIVREFFEKKDNPPGNKANGALYVVGREFIEFVRDMDPKPSDISLDILPRILGRIYSWHTNEDYIDIGSLNSLVYARKLCRRLSRDHGENKQLC